MTSETLQEEVKTEVKNLERRVVMIAIGFVLVAGGGIAALAYLSATNTTVYIDKSDIEAPEVDLAPTTPGVLRNVFVEEGQLIAANTIVAQVGNELIKSTSGGLVISASKDTGKNVAAGSPVVKVIDPRELRAVGRLAEDKGLADVKVGEQARFTVDAFGGKQYEGVVSEVSPTSRDSDVVFSISDKRETKEFDVKVYFDPGTYPELKNGMSARIWIYKN
ncbi:HlyD family efflux transporter periplasmic adaptor subunit [Candidatus Kaiserbacteria bacterium]|nr:HlyD family efflux transporter periplasmic adaptor subunit [Candidatus Kaiserbacteria bacterium]